MLPLWLRVPKEKSNTDSEILFNPLNQIMLEHKGTLQKKAV